MQLLHTLSVWNQMGGIRCFLSPDLIDSVELERTVSNLNKELTAAREAEEALRAQLEELSSFQALPEKVDSLTKQVSPPKTFLRTVIWDREHVASSRVISFCVASGVRVDRGAVCCSNSERRPALKSSSVSGGSSATQRLAADIPGWGSENPSRLQCCCTEGEGAEWAACWCDTAAGFTSLRPGPIWYREESAHGYYGRDGL